MQNKHICTVHFYFTLRMHVLPLCVFQLRPRNFAALKGPICIRPLQEASSSITVSVNIVSSHFPIGSLVLRFTAFMFSDLCTHRPSPGFALWHPPAITHKTNFNITCSQHIKMPLLKKSFSLFLALFRHSLWDLGYYGLCFFFSFLLHYCFEKCSCISFHLMQVEDDGSCIAIDYIFKCLKKFFIVKKVLINVILQQLLSLLSESNTTPHLFLKRPSNVLA